MGPPSALRLLMLPPVRLASLSTGEKLPTVSSLSSLGAMMFVSNWATAPRPPPSWVTGPVRSAPPPWPRLLASSRILTPSPRESLPPGRLLLWKARPLCRLPSDCVSAHPCSYGGSLRCPDRDHPRVVSGCDRCLLGVL